MPSAGNVISSTGSMAASGALVGSVVPGVGTLVGGAIGGFVGLLGSIFGGGESPEEIMKRRKIEAQKAVAKAYAMKRAELAKETRSTVARAEQGATRRALSTGRSATAGDVAAATGQVYSEGGKALRDLQAAEAEQMASIEAGYAARPIEEDMPLSDVIQSLGASAANIALINRQIQAVDAQKTAADNVQITKVAPEGTYLTEEALGIPKVQPTLPRTLEPVPVPGEPQAEPGKPLGAITEEGIGNVLTALQSSNPNAQGAVGARQGWANRMYNNSQAKVPGTYRSLMSQIGGRG